MARRGGQVRETGSTPSVDSARCCYLKHLLRYKLEAESPSGGREDDGLDQGFATWMARVFTLGGWGERGPSQM